MIVVGKLVDGTEIIGDMIGESENGIQISHPLQIVYKYSLSSTVPSVSFARFMMFADQQEFDFQKVDFMIVAQAVPEMVGIYHRLLSQILPEEKEEGDVMATVKGDTPITDSKAEFYKALLQSLEPKDMTKH